MNRNIIVIVFACASLSAMAGTSLYSNPVINESAPDPTVIRADDGRFYLYATENVRNVPIYSSDNLFWGSFRGIYGIELTPDGLALKPGSKPRQIAGTLTEGTNIYRHDGRYYLIGSAGTCCDGERSTYHEVAARSENLFGPYVNKEGLPAMENNFSPVIERSDKVIGPGHNANFVMDDACNHWMHYHGFDA